MIDGAGPPPPADRGPATARWRRPLIVIAVVLVAGAVTAGVLMYRHATRDRVERAEVGDCLVRQYEVFRPYRIVGCDDPVATHRVLAIYGDEDKRSCGEVAGASVDEPVDGRKFCLGRRDVDPATAINVAKEGDCIYAELPPNRPTDPIRLDCAEPRANLKVLKRLGVGHQIAAQYGEPCKEVAGTVKTHAWSWQSSDPRFAGLSSTTVLCLGWKVPPPPKQPSPSPGDPNAPNSNCRFLTADQVSAAVSKAAGRKHTVTDRATSALDYCQYRFGGLHNVVMTGMTFGNPAFRPGTADQTLTVDGLRAIWGPGEGTRALSVWLPNGKFTTIVWLRDIDEAMAKKIAIEVFRTVRPQLG